MGAPKIDRIAVGYLFEEPLDGPYWLGWATKATPATLKEVEERLALDVERGVTRDGLLERLEAVRAQLAGRGRGKRGSATATAAATVARAAKATGHA